GPESKRRHVVGGRDASGMRSAGPGLVTLSVVRCKENALCQLRTTNQRKAAGGVLTAKQAPHRPGTAPALGLRAGCDVFPFYRRPWEDSTMLPFSSKRAKSRPRPAPYRPRLEVLEDRSLPSCTVSLLPSEPAPQLVGERILWTATAADCGATPVYQFSAAPQGGAFHVVRDFSPANAFAWTPMQEGTYDIEVTVKDGYQASETTTAAAADAVASRVTRSQAVITPTLNPLVALYSAPPSSADSVFVQFSVAGDSPSWRNTNTLPVVPGKSTNFFVAGMLPNTTYEMRDVMSDGTGSAPLLFTTGSLPTTLTFPSFIVQQPPGPGSDHDQDMIFEQF